MPLKIVFSDRIREVRSLANGLLALGLRRPDRVAVLLRNCAEYMEVDFGLAKAGLVRVALNARLGIPKGLGAMGLGQDTAEKIADGALGDHCHLSTPRQPTREQYLQLIEESWG